MKALTILQPWADLIIRGFKHYETRGHSINYRGPLAIHAGQYRPLPHELWLEIAEAIEIPPDQYEGSWLWRLEKRKDPSRFGAVLGTAELYATAPTSMFRVQPMERALGDYTPGRSIWLLDRVKPFETPVPARGKQGLWNWDPEKS